jgi:hypothetical protein
MSKRYVIVEAWVPEMSDGVPTPPIYYPPGVWPVPPQPPDLGIWPGPGYPAHPIAPGGPPPSVWPGPGYPAHPIAPGGPPPGVWPGPERPDQGLPVPPAVWPGPGNPAHPIAPGGPPPGVWPGPGRPDQGLPVPPSVWPGPGSPAHPIAPGGPPPGIWGGAPPWVDVTPPGQQQGLPTVDPDDLPDHPEVPDLNAGNWTFVQDPETDATVGGFVPWPLAVTHPDYTPDYPTQGLPGNWVLVGVPGRESGGLVTWCWIPSETEAAAPPEVQPVKK